MKKTLLVLLFITSFGNVKAEFVIYNDLSDIEFVYGGYITSNNNGGWYLCGTTYGMNSNLSYNAYLINCNNIGSTLWSLTTQGGSYKFPLNITTTINNEIIICGESQNTSSEDYNGLIIKVDTNKNILFSKSYGGAKDDDFLKAIPYNDTSFLALGTTNSYGVQKQNILLVKYNAIGDTLYSKLYNGNNELWFLDATKDSGEIVTVYVREIISSDTDNLLSFQIDTNGNIFNEFDYDLNIAGQINALCEQNDSIIITGKYQSDMFMMKISDSGDSIWFRKYESEYTSEGKNLILKDPDSFFAVAEKECESVSDFFNNYDVWLFYVDASNGDTLWTRTYGGDYMEHSKDIAYQDNKVFISGISQPIESANQFPFLSITNIDTVSVNLNLSSNNLEELNFFPNPVSDYLFFEGSDFDNAKTSIYSMEGKLIFETRIQNKYLDLSCLKRGTYVVSIKNKNMLVVKK